jgi:hypothetical protein
LVAGLLLADFGQVPPELICSATARIAHRRQTVGEFLLNLPP